MSSEIDCPGGFPFHTHKLVDVEGKGKKFFCTNSDCGFAYLEVSSGKNYWKKGFMENVLNA